jgi:two-component system sensor histidine kinase SenX3
VTSRREDVSSPGPNGPYEESADDQLARLDFENRAFIAAMGLMSQGVMVTDCKGEMVFCNEPASQWMNSDALVDVGSDIHEVAALAGAGNVSARSLDLLGPPRQSVKITGVPVRTNDGAPCGSVVLFEDTTEQRHFEASRRDFIANVSHELKTPVGALGLLAETLLVEKDPDVVSRLLNRMYVETSRVAQVIDDLLSLSRLESVRPVAFEVINARSLVDQAVNRVRVTAEHHDNIIRVSGDDGAMVYGSHRDIVSALHHLLENALKYSGDGSSVEVMITADGDWTEIAVTDHGIGIAEKYVERIFERFYRVDDARTRTTGGTGLGLSIVRHVVRDHDGDVRVSSKEGEGSTFTVRFAAGPSAATKRLVVEGGTDG